MGNYKDFQKKMLIYQLTFRETSVDVVMEDPSQIIYQVHVPKNKPITIEGHATVIPGA